MFYDPCQLGVDYFLHVHDLGDASIQAELLTGSQLCITIHRHGVISGLRLLLVIVRGHLNRLRLSMHEAAAPAFQRELSLKLNVYSPLRKFLLKDPELIVRACCAPLDTYLRGGLILLLQQG